jgi:hypothetical protein
MKLRETVLPVRKQAGLFSFFVNAFLFDIDTGISGIYYGRAAVFSEKR